MGRKLKLGCGGLLVASFAAVVAILIRDSSESAMRESIEKKVGLPRGEVYGLYLRESDPERLEALARECKAADLTGLFCTSLIERLSRGRNGKDAKEDIYAGADRREAEAGRGADRTRPDGSTGVPRG